MNKEQVIKVENNQEQSLKYEKELVGHQIKNEFQLSEEIQHNKSKQQQNHQEIHQLEKQLNEGLIRHELQDINQLFQEIEERKEYIAQLEKKGQHKKAKERKNSLEDMITLVNIHQQLESQKAIQIKEKNENQYQDLQNQFKELEKKLQEGLDKYEIKESLLPEEIKERKYQIETLQKKGQNKKILERKSSLEDLEQLLGISQKLENLNSRMQQLNEKKQTEILISNQQQGQDKLKIESKPELSIQQNTHQIELLENKQQINKDIEKNISQQELCQQQLQQITSEVASFSSNFKQEEIAQNEICNSDQNNNIVPKQEEHQNESVSGVGSQHIQRNIGDDKVIVVENKIKDSLTRLYQHFSEMPDCTEQTLMKLIYYTSLILIDPNTINDYGLTVPEQLENEIQKQLGLLVGLLKIEEKYSNEIKKSLDNIIKISKNYDWQTTRNELENLLIRIRPLNTRELSYLITKANQAAEQISDQDVILFIGGTGTGKSTTIHFLAGSKMVEKQLEMQPGVILKYIGPVEPVNNIALRNITVSPLAKSETRYITPVTVKYKDIGGHKNGGNILCDAPGFGDTGGPEVDIANGIGITQAIQGCKSVRPVVLVSALSIGDRGEGVKKLAHLLVGMINGIQNYLSAFTYVFTKFPPETDIYAYLLNIMQSLQNNTEYNNDQTLLNLFDDMLQKTEEKPIRINPIQDKPIQILNQILNASDPITSTKDIFRFSITDQSKATLNEQASIYYKNIIQAVKISNYSIVKYNLDDLKYLNDLLNQEFINENYIKSLGYVCDSLNKKYEETMSQFNKCINNQLILGLEDINQYSNCVQLFNSIENLREQHLGTNVVSSSSLIQNLESQADSIVLGFSEIDIIKMKTGLKNIELLASKFFQIAPKYQQIIIQFGNYIEQQVNQAYELIQKNEFSQISGTLTIIKKFNEILDGHVDLKIIQTIIESLVQFLMTYLESISQSVDNILNQSNKIQETDIKKIQDAVAIFVKLKGTLELRDHIQMDRVDDIYQNLLNKIIRYIGLISQKINELLKTQGGHSFKQIENLINDMDALRMIPETESKTQEIYYKSIQAIITFVQGLSGEAEKVIGNFSDQNSNINWNKVSQYIAYQKNSEWIDRIHPGTSINLITNITEALTDYTKNLFNKILEKDIDLAHYSNLSIVHELVKQIDAIPTLEQVDQELDIYKEKVNKKFEGTIEQTLNYIQEYFNFEKYNSQPQENKFSRINGQIAEDSLHYTNSCKKIQFTMETAPKIYMNLQNFMKNYGEMIQNEILNCYNKIINTNPGENNEIQICSQKLAYRMQELSELKKYPQTCKLIEGEQLLTQWNQILDRLHIDFTDQLNQDQLDQKALRSKLEIVKCLCQLDQKFYDIYKQFQSTLKNEFTKEYNNILQYIENHDYLNVMIQLSQIEYTSNNQRIINQIKQILTQQILDLVKNTKNKVVMLENTLELKYIESLVIQFNKIESAAKYICNYSDESTQSQQNNQSLINEDAKKQFNQFYTEIQDIISKKILSNLENIDAQINLYNFYEAEQRQEYIKQLCSLLGNYYQTEVIQGEINKMQEKLEQIAQNISEEYSKKEISHYTLNPPKNIYEKLKKVSTLNSKYAHSLNKFKEYIFLNVRQNLKEAQEVTYDKCHSYLKNVEQNLWTLPEDIQTIIKSDIDEVKQVIKYKETNFKKEFNEKIQTGDIQQIYSFMVKCKENKMDGFYLLTQNEMIKQVHNLYSKIKEEFNKENYTSALTQFQRQIEYVNLFGKNISEIDSISNEAINLLSKKLDNLCQIQINFKSIDKTELIEQDFQNFTQILYFIDQNPLHFRDLFSAKQSNIYNVFQKASQLFSENEQIFYQTLEDLNTKLCNNSLDTIKKWNNFFLKIKQHIVIYDQNDIVIASLIKCKYYPELLNELVTKFIQLKNIVTGFVFPKIVEDFNNKIYQDLQKCIEALQNLNVFKDHIVSESVLKLDCYLNECLPKLSNKLETILEEALNIMQKIDKLSKNDYDKFKCYYKNMILYDNFVKNSGIDIKGMIDQTQQKVEQRIENLQKRILEDKVENNEICNNLIEMKNIADNIHQFKDKINKQIDDILKQYKSKNLKNGGLALAQLSILLEEDPSGVGNIILSEHSCFKGELISLFNSDTQRQDIDYVLDNIDGDQIVKDVLKMQYTKFDNDYKNLLKKYIHKLESKMQTKEEIFDDLTTQIKLIPSRLTHKPNQITWDQITKDKAINLMAHIFVLWTLQNIQFYSEMEGSEKRNNYLLQPHSGQVISIFRMLGIGLDISENLLKMIAKLIKESKTGYGKEGLINNLVQIETGEGKSVILGVTCCVLTLLGLNVSCACYSEYLSSRDYQYFLPIFEALGITQYINYGTFNKICENIINEQGDIRTRVSDLILNRDVSKTKSIKTASQRPKVLLIDEVDVFFTKEFYGNLYTPQTFLRDPTIIQLTNCIWNNKNNQLTLKKIESTPEYRACCNLFKGWEFLIKEAVKDMLVDVINFRHDYIVHNDRIAYKEQDGITYNISYGFKTLFAYYYEHEQGKISKHSLNENIGIGIKCGNFSYKEIPYLFQSIMGVTGTLKTLSDSERDIIQNEYNINIYTYMPSVFGKNNRKFAKQADVFVENKDDYFNILRQQIDYKLGKGDSQRAVLVFFESKEKLMLFYHSKNLAPIRSSVQIMTEEISFSPNEKDLIIKRSTTSGQITLLTRAFGRGTDFVCRDHKVIVNGGIHVIQTFFSEEYSEEVQIMGRTARQGKDGSYSMILLDEDLEKYLGPTFTIQIQNLRGANQLYEGLDKMRNEFFKKKYSDIGEYVKEAEKEHNTAQQFIQSMNKQNLEMVRKFLSFYNKGAQGEKYSRTICLMDATASMGHLLNQTKNTVDKMFTRAQDILQEHKIPPDCFQMQFAVYRDYDCGIDGILQYSSWETKPDNLRQFMSTISAKGGGDYEEAIEIGLWHANQENNNEEITQVIIIGDAPAKSKEIIIEYRNICEGESKWKSSKFGDVTYYKNEIKKLKNNEIPVHAFYLNKGAQINFKEMADFTNGSCQFLDINSSDGSERLTQIVTEEILNNVGAKDGKGEQLVKAYRAKYVEKSYLA